MEGEHGELERPCKAIGAELIGGDREKRVKEKEKEKLEEWEGGEVMTNKNPTVIPVVVSISRKSDSEDSDEGRDEESRRKQEERGNSKDANFSSLVRLLFIFAQLRSDITLWHMTLGFDWTLLNVPF